MLQCNCCYVDLATLTLVVRSENGVGILNTGKKFLEENTCIEGLPPHG